MAEQSKFWYLKHFNIFDGLDESAMKKVSDMTTMSTVESHQPIYFPDEPSRSIFFLKEGHVKISRLSPEGKEVIIDIIGPGEIFGELAIVDKNVERDEIAQTLDDVLICAMRIEDFEYMLMKNPDLNLKMTKRIGLRLRKIEERVSDLVFKNVQKRIAGFLVRYAEEFGKIKHGIVSMNTHLSHEEIGFLTGSARQTVTTILNEFRSSGLIDFSRKGIVIKNLDELKKLSK